MESPPCATQSYDGVQFYQALLTLSFHLSLKGEGLNHMGGLKFLILLVGDKGLRFLSLFVHSRLNSNFLLKVFFSE